MSFVKLFNTYGRIELPLNDHTHLPFIPTTAQLIMAMEVEIW